MHETASHHAVLMVRIDFPPAGSLRTLGPSREILKQRRTEHGRVEGETNRRHGLERASLSLVKRSGLDSIQCMCAVANPLSGRDSHWPPAVILVPEVVL